MIVPMRQFSILVYHRDFAAFMGRLQDEGLLDIRQEEIHSAKADTEFFPVLERVGKVLSQLKAEKKEMPAGKDFSAGKAGVEAMQGEALLAEAERLLLRKTELRAQVEQVSGEVKAASVWGDFDAARLQELREKADVGLVLAAASAKRFPKSEGEARALYPVQRVGEKDGMAYFVWVTTAGEAERMTPDLLGRELGTSVDILPFPRATYSVLAQEERTLQNELREVQERIHALAAFGQPRLEAYQTDLFNRLEYKTVSLNVPNEAEGTLRWVEGYLPEEQASAFEAFLQREDVVYQTRAAEEVPEEKAAEIPVLLRNGWFGRLFEPITNLFSLPSYREIDLTPALAPFFMAFFGFCLGDAGYGLLIIAAGLYLAFKLPQKLKGIAWLAFWLGIGTVVFGTLSGTFFGVELVKIEALGKFRSFIFDSNQMMTLSLAIGAVQIIFGMALDVARITKMQGFKYALYRLGWIFVLVFGAMLIGLPKLGVAAPAPVNYALYALTGLGAVFALFYNNPDKNILLNFGSGLWATYNTATGLVGDLLSYIRLFALGLTGGILGSVFNTLALDAAAGVGVPVVSQLIMLAILLFGHSLNLALCVLGALVHPIRLTFVEFYKNAGFAGGGKAYKPFMKKN